MALKGDLEAKGAGGGTCVQKTGLMLETHGRIFHPLLSPASEPPVELQLLHIDFEASLNNSGGGGCAGWAFLSETGLARNT